MRRAVLTGVLGGAVMAASLVGPAWAQEDDAPPEDPGQVSDDPGVVDAPTDNTPVTLPLIPVPVGCEAPPQPYIVFVGTVRNSDFRTVRFRVDSVRYGRTAPFGARDLIDVRYGLDAQYLEDDEQYLVSAIVDQDLGLLVSRVTEPIEHFGGDEVIGVSETDVDCPEFEDPVTTVHLDGTQLDAGVLRPFWGSKTRIAAAFLVPFGLAVAVIFVLATLRLSMSGLYHSVVDSGRRRPF